MYDETMINGLAAAMAAVAETRLKGWRFWLLRRRIRRELKAELLADMRQFIGVVITSENKQEMVDLAAQATQRVLDRHAPDRFQRVLDRMVEPLVDRLEYPDG